jgi:FAD/FMN-containing dehydrogenase
MGQDSRVSELVLALRALVGEEHCITDPDVMATFTTDWSGRFTGSALCVVRPVDTAQVADVLRTCSRFGAPVVPQGGNTGLVGGSVPGSTPAVILSTRRLQWIDPIDDVSGQVTVGAGATLADVQRHARAAGWRYGVDLAARDSATIGGTIATNAGGIHVIGLGMTRAQVLGIEAVLPDGSVVSHLSGLMKDNTGLDLTGIFCGSEGTLGVITAARMLLHRPPDATTVAFIGVEDFDAAIAVMNAHRTPALVAAEVMDAACMQRVVDYLGVPMPLAQSHPVTVLIEIADGGDGGGLVIETDVDAVLAFDRADHERLWQYREMQGEAWSALGVCHRVDVSVPLPQMQAFIAEVRGVIANSPGVTAFGFFGHIGDGNVHAEVIGPPSDDMGVDHAILECVARFGGSISAEHGIGRAKVDKLTLSRSGAEIRAMRAIKDALDPKGLMNPGVLFPVL